MLGGQRRVELIGNVTDKPTYGQTLAASFEKPFVQAEQLINYIFPGSSTEETRKKNADRISYIDELTSNPYQGFGQKSANAVSNLIGGVIPTLPFMFGGEVALGATAGVIGFGARKLALEAATDYGSEALLSAYTASQVPLKTLATGQLAKYVPSLSLAEIGTGVAKAYGGYKGVIIPEKFSEHYDAIANTLDSKHAIEDWASDNYGFLLGGAPLAAGYVAYKGVRGVIAIRKAHLTRKAIDAEHDRLMAEHKEILAQNKIKESEKIAREAKVSELQEHLQQAVKEGLISEKEHDWYLNYLENPNHPEIHERGLGILQDLQIPVDRFTGRVWHEVLNREDIENLKGALLDQGITNLPEELNQQLSSYIIKNALDRYRDDVGGRPALLDAIRGMTQALGIRITEQRKAITEFEGTLEKNLTKNLNKENVFSQKKIYKHLKDLGVTNAQVVPYHVPKNIQRKLKLEKKLAQFEKGTEEYNAIEHEIESIHVLTPKEELTDIKNTLLPEGKLIKNYKNNDAYYRLEELSQVWPQARHLLNRIALEAFNAKQEALNNMLKHFVEMVDSTAGRIASPDNVKRYLHNRIEQAAALPKELTEPGIKIKDNVLEEEAGESQASSPETLYNETSTKVVEETELKDAKERFQLSEKKYRQLKENESALSELIKCALGE